VEGRLYLRLLSRNSSLIAVIVVLSVIIGLLLYAISPPRYESALSFIVQPTSSSNSPAEIYQGELLAQARAQLYGRLVTGPAVAELISDRLGGDPTAARVQQDVTPSVQDASVVLDITVQDRSAAVAGSIARALADELPGYVTTLEASPATPTTALREVSQPSRAGQVAPTLAGTVGLALLGGLVLAFALAILRELTNRRVRDRDDVRGVVGQAPIVMDLRAPSRSRHRRSSDRGLAPLSVLITAAAIQSRPVAVVPLAPTQRASEWVLDLATRLSSSGERIGLVDADLEGRHLSTQAPWHPLPGHFAADGSTAAEAQKAGSVEIVGADVVAALAAGTAPSDSAEPLAAELLGAAVAKVISELSERSDVVLVMTGTVLLRSRPAFLSTDQAEVIVLVERGRTHREELRTAVDVVRQLGSEVGGVVLVDHPPKVGRH
jgi:succinoglycan biosynthesis transport protein ExoP